MAFTYSAASAYTVTGAGTLASPYTVSTALGNGMYTYSANDLSFISSEAGTFYYDFSGSFTDGMTTMNVTIGGSSLYYESVSSYSRNGSSVQASATTLLFSLYNMMGADWTFAGSLYFVPASAPTPTPTPTNIIKPKRSYTATNTPTLASGELGINAADGKIFLGNAAGSANVLVGSLNYSDLVGTPAGGGGTVTTASVVSANGFAGTVATATTTPAITISTSITGILKGNATAISAATAGTDYLVPTSPAITTPTITGLNEFKTAPTIASGVLALNCAIGNVFHVSLNAAITSITFSNIPASNTAYGLTLAFTMDGTARAVTWGSAIKWSGGTAPTLTSTLNKVDIFVLTTWDAGTTWYALVGGQNF